MDSSGSWSGLKAAYAQLAGVTALPAVGAHTCHWLVFVFHNLRRA